MGPTELGEARHFHIVTKHGGVHAQQESNAVHSLPDGVAMQDNRRAQR